MPANVESFSYAKGTKERYSEKPVLTEKESEVLDLVAQGLTNEEIGRSLFRSSQAIRTRIRGMLRKFGADNRTELVACAFRAGIIS